MLLPSGAAVQLLFPVWCYVDRLEQCGEISELEARRWKREIFSVMLERGLEPEDVYEYTIRRPRSPLMERGEGQMGNVGLELTAPNPDRAVRTERPRVRFQNPAARSAVP